VKRTDETGLINVMVHNTLSMKDAAISLRYLELEKDLLSLERTFCV